MATIRMHTKAPLASFLKSALILISKPHVVNKRLWGHKVLIKITGEPINDKWQLPENFSRLKEANSTTSSILEELNIIQCTNTDVPSNSIIEVFLVELLPKCFTEKHAFQLICVNKLDSEVLFYDITPLEYSQNICPGFTYKIRLINNEIVLTANCDADSKTWSWIQNNIFKTFIKWMEEDEKSQSNTSQSLALVCNDRYYQMYNNLKLKYGKRLVEIWPECTDPSKFVYEDVAIATYLLLLWEDERTQNNSHDKQTFLDLGCGNGLLVYILTMEGHQGVGLDVRKRQIWDMYDHIQLEEKTLLPSEFHKFPKTDWVIGNHSDELTPWIPVFAAVNSYECNFFLLPCCAYNFDGTKYQRVDSSRSQYMDYLDYVKKLCDYLGFNISLDRLKIPSTKRLCLVSKGRIYPRERFTDYYKQAQDIIQTTVPEKGVELTNSSSFKTREPVERVRNCTQINKSLIQDLVKLITNYLLQDCNIEQEWYPGRLTNLDEIANIVPKDKLKALKSECGGIQTLLKNHHHIFKVQSGKVQLRFPKTVDEVKSVANKKGNSANIQQKLCWFYSNHPQGCPLTDTNCSFLHVTI